MYKIIVFEIILKIQLILSLQHCDEEVSVKGISVTWPASELSRQWVDSNPICYNNETILRRYCNSTGWTPSLKDLDPCLRVEEHIDINACPPGFSKISENIKDICYQISPPSAWNFPCFKSGGASVITDLTAEEINSLIDSLLKSNTSRYYWLPAHRPKFFNPLVWYIPGPRWRRPLHSSNNSLIDNTSVLKNCLVLDIEERAMMTEYCSTIYPSLCFYLNDIFYPAQCPEGYHAFRFMADNGTCYGIEVFNDSTDQNIKGFLDQKCDKLMGDSDSTNLTKFLFVKIAEVYELPDDAWCWFKTTSYLYDNNNITVLNESFNEDSIALVATSPLLEGVINNKGTVRLQNIVAKLSCMACEAEMVYQNTLLNLIYNEIDSKLYLTIYFPSGLWKYDDNDKGIQCFSDALGFVSVVDISNMPYIEFEAASQRSLSSNLSNVEKTVYNINLITQTSAQYWCEGHTKKFTFIKTEKILANPRGSKYHVFALFINFFTQNEEVLSNNFNNISNLITFLTPLFYAERVLLMDIFEYTSENMLVLIHVHLAVNETHKDETSNLITTFNILKDRVNIALTDHNAILVNITSSINCFPISSKEPISNLILDWALTEVGHTAAPKQFCLNSNGLPVMRRCVGSYLRGCHWGPIMGYCNENYEPSLTTAFLYSFVSKGHIYDDLSSQFLTKGLNFVLSNVNIIIPADIYYLAMSLRQVVKTAHQNKSLIDMGDMENMAWVMDRILVLDNEHLRLAQSLNSTNVILDSVHDVIEELSCSSFKSTNILQQDNYQLSVKPNFVIQVSYPAFNNISGIAIINPFESANFTEMIIQPLYTNSTMDDILSIKNLELATWLSCEVLDNIKKISNEAASKEDVHIVISIYNNDAIFQQLDNTELKINSRVIGITVPELISNLEYPVPLIFKETNTSIYEKLCGYWDFKTKDKGKNPGFWTDHGCFYVSSPVNMTVCECYHMTNFGHLIDLGSIKKNKNFIKHSKALNIISLVGCFLSLLGVAGIWVTACVFQTWRKKAGTKVLLQLSTAIACPLVIFLVFNLDTSIFVYDDDNENVVAQNMKIICITLGAMMHYSILASFMWMLITAVLQFIRYVRVLGAYRPSRFMFKFTLIGWGIPLVPVIIVLVLDNENYIPKNPAHRGICYPNGFYYLMCVLLPITLILIINISLFISVIYAISRGPDGKMRSTDIDLVSSQLRLSVFLFFLLGLTWYFGIFSLTGSLLFSYLFCLTSTMQGFVLFIYFIICDSTTRNLWISIMKPQFNTSFTPRASISISSS